MWMALSGTALLMGIAGTPHCVAMCGAACGGVTRLARAPGPGAQLRFQLGRFAGYVTAGVVAGGAGGSVAWLAGQTAALRPLWTLFHLGVLAWALMLLAAARQPAWVGTAGRAAWRRVQPLAQGRGGMVAAGMLWIFMPCGLLWSALLVASLSGGPVQGGIAMAMFALPGAAALVLGPALLPRLRQAADRLVPGGGTRAAGLLLALVAAWALWMDVGERIALFCQTVL